MPRARTPVRKQIAPLPTGAVGEIAGGIGTVKGGATLALLFICYALTFYTLTASLNLIMTDEDIRSIVHRSYTESSGYAANVTNRFIRIISIVLSIYVIASRWTLARSLGKIINPGFAAFLVLASLSALWSIDRSATLLRFTNLACLALLCFAISLAGWNRQRLQQMAIPPALCVLVVSLILGVMHPDKITELGSDISQRNAWHGILYSKNMFGMFAGAAVILCANRWLAREGRTFWFVPGIGIAFLCLILSRSSTSLLATVLGVLFMILAMRVPVVKQRYTTKLVVGIAVTLLVYELVVQNVIPGTNLLLAPIAGLTGKDTTFSERTMIWFLIKEHIRAAPWFGTGYGAYWTGLSPGTPSYVFWWRMFFYPTESHNGYLEIMNDLGVAGLATLLGFLYWYLRQGLELMKFDRTQAVLYLALLFQAMVINMSESDWFSARDTNFVILTLATACMARALLEHRQRAPTVEPTGARPVGDRTSKPRVRLVDVRRGHAQRRKR
jgi:O-antigen ligase